MKKSPGSFCLEIHFKFIAPWLSRYPCPLDLMYVRMVLIAENLTAFSWKSCAAVCKI